MSTLLLLCLLQIPDIVLPFPEKPKAEPPKVEPKYTPSVEPAPQTILPLDVPSEAEARVIENAAKTVMDNWAKKVTAEYQTKLSRVKADYQLSYKNAYYDHIILKKDVQCFATRAKVLTENYHVCVQDAQKEYLTLLNTKPVIPVPFSLPLYVGSCARSFSGSVGVKESTVLKGDKSFLKLETTSGSCLLYLRKKEVEVPYLLCTGVRNLDGELVYIVDTLDWTKLDPPLK